MFKKIVTLNCLILLMVVSSFAQNYIMPGSLINYPGASLNNPFVATIPYVVNIQGVDVTIPLYGSSRTFDYSGNVPFINPVTGNADPAMMQAWDPVFAQSFVPPLSGDYNLPGYLIINSGFPGRVEKQMFAGIPTNMTRYNAGNGTTAGCPRSKLLSYAVPPLTHVRWELELSFGKTDGTNDWILHSSGSNQVLFWQLKSNSQGNPALSANVDTDNLDSTKLMIYFARRTGGDPNPSVIGEIHGLERHTMISIIIESFLDERLTSNGGMGLIQAWVNGTLVSEALGPTLVIGTNPHWWDFGVYDWSQNAPYPYTMAIFFKTAKMFVFPVISTGVPSINRNKNGYEIINVYPNPFNPVTHINYEVKAKGFVTLKVYDALGKEVSILVNEVKNPGKYILDFNAALLSCGVYFCKLEVNGFSTIKKLIVLK